MAEKVNRDSLAVLHTYNTFANNIVIDTLAELSEDEFNGGNVAGFDNIKKLVLHMLSAEAYFLNICQGKSSQLEAYETLDQIRTCWEQLSKESQGYIRGLRDGDLDEVVTIYLDDKPYDFPLWQILVQAFVHSAHHRGELANAVHGLGYEYPRFGAIFQFLEQQKPLRSHHHGSD